MEYFWLIIWWLSFCILHSLFAAEWWKSRARQFTGRFFIYYRLLYSAFAFLHLGAVLIYQLRMDDYSLWNPGRLIIGITLPFVLTGFWIMTISVYKYFFDLSGIAVFFERPVREEVFTNGLHRYVRHPLYAGTLLFVWALFIIFPLVSNGIACLTMTLYTLVGIKLEEKKLLNEKGEDYKKYREETPMLIPGFSAYHGSIGQK